ncbi:MAG: tRNA lysidine(34) synthetase TilS [Bdellovibrionota bacterium]|jgi:tRNA(Ile)-lysidine synthetase-like protein
MARPKMDLLRALRESLPVEKRLLLAVSGGKDSVVLLHGCYRLAKSMKLTLEVGHVDHHIRENSKDDANFVADLAQKYGFPFHLCRAEEPPKTENLEAWGRGLRYSFFAEVLKKRELDFVLTAHTANDVAETLLMRLFSNKEPTSIERYDPQRRCIRPLLSVSRNTIEQYLEENGLEFREDITNTDVSYLRNRVRHRVLPLLREEFDSRIDEVLALRAACLHDDIMFLRSLVLIPVQNVSGYELFSRDWLRAVKGEMAKLPPPLRWRYAEALLLPVMGFAIGRSHGSRAMEFLCGNTQGVELPSGVTLRAKNGGVAFEKIEIPPEKIN